MKAEDPLHSYLLSKGLVYDCEVADLLSALNLPYRNELAEPYLDCFCASSYQDFTTVAKECAEDGQVNFYPGFYTLEYVGSGLTGCFMISGGKEEVVRAILDTLMIEAIDEAFR